MLYYDDPYAKTFHARVTRAEEAGGGTSRVVLDDTAFYPGGGGQACDNGIMRVGGEEGEISEVFKEGEEIVHMVQGLSLSEDQKVECELNWDRRYELMRAHTCEHLFFGCLSKVIEGIAVEKDNLDEGVHELFVRAGRAPNPAEIMRAEAMANRIIGEGREVIVHVMSREQAEAKSAEFRAKFDKIKGDEIRVVEIDGFDKSACTGVHVKNIKELGMLAVRKVSAAGEFWKLELEFGDDALRLLLERKGVATEACEAAGTTEDKLGKTITNLRQDNDEMKTILEKLSEKRMDGITGRALGKAIMYSKVFEFVDRKKLSEKAGELVKKGKSIAILGDKSGENGFLVIAKSDDVQVDLLSIASEAFDFMGGKGGGRNSFVQGAGEAGRLDEAVSMAERKVEEKLK